MALSRWQPGQLPGKQVTVRLYLSLAVSLVIHIYLLNLAPGLPSWAGLEASGDPRPLSVFIPAFNSLAQQQLSTLHSPLPDSTSTVIEKETRSTPRENYRSVSADHKVEQTSKPSPSGSFPGPWYYPAKYLHRHPTPLKPIWPAYPENGEHIGGRVLILLLINEEGTVDQYRIQQAGPSDFFDKSVIDAFTSARFAPGLIAGYAVKSQLLAEVSFEPGAQSSPSYKILETLTPVPSAGGN